MLPYICPLDLFYFDIETITGVGGLSFENDDLKSRQKVDNFFEVKTAAGDLVF